MNEHFEKLKLLIKEADTSIDFDNLTKSIQDTLLGIQNDTSILPFQKDSAINGGRAAIEKLNSRFNNPEELNVHVKSFCNSLSQNSNTDIENIYNWFFKLAYSDVEISSEIENNFKIILAVHSPNQGSNKQKLDKDCDKYLRFANEGPDLKLCRNNLKGILIASRIYMLPESFPEKLREKAESGLDTLSKREKKSNKELVKEVLTTCENIINSSYDNYKKVKQHYLDQSDSWFLNIYLSQILNMIDEDDIMDEEVSIIKQKINDLRFKFQIIRCRTSTVLYFQVVEKNEVIQTKLSRGIDFKYFKEEVKNLQGLVKEYSAGKKGINRMEPFHVRASLAFLSKSYQDILKKENSNHEIELELKRLESEFVSLTQREIPPTAGYIQKLQNYTKSDSMLSIWINNCYPNNNSDYDNIQSCIIKLRNGYDLLWHKMEEYKKQRFSHYLTQIEELKKVIEQGNDFNEYNYELRQIERSIQDLPKKMQLEILKDIDNIKSVLFHKINNYEQLNAILEQINNQIALNFKRIKYHIKFDRLIEELDLTKKWIYCYQFNSEQKRTYRAKIFRFYNQIDNLKNIQAKRNAERAAISQELFEDLMIELTESTLEATSNPGNKENWQMLVDIDKRYHELLYQFNDAQKNELLTKINEGFSKIREIRKQFAIQSSIFYSYYNDELTNILNDLEENPSRDSALEAIERIKPLRNKFKTEKQLLASQKYEIKDLLSTISNTIDDVFEEAKLTENKKFNEILSSIERLEEMINHDISPSYSASIVLHKQISKEINDRELSISNRKELRNIMDNIWSIISEKIRSKSVNRFNINCITDTIAQLEIAGYLLFSPQVPSI